MKGAATAGMKKGKDVGRKALCRRACVSINTSPWRQRLKRESDANKSCEVVDLIRYSTSRRLATLYSVEHDTKLHHLAWLISSLTYPRIYHAPLVTLAQVDLEFSTCGEAYLICLDQCKFILGKQGLTPAAKSRLSPNFTTSIFRRFSYNKSTKNWK